MFVGSTAADVYHPFWFLNSAEPSRISFASRGLRGEKTRSNLCIYVIALSGLKGPFQVGNLCQNQHLESQKSSRLRHLAGKLPQSITHVPLARPQTVPLQEWAFGTVHFCARSRSLNRHLDSKQDRSAFLAVLIIVPRSTSRSWSRFDPQRSLLVPEQQLFIVSNWWQLAFLRRLSSFSLFIKKEKHAGLGRSKGWNSPVASDRLDSAVELKTQAFFPEAQNV